jgi:hypothetical protein
MKRILKRLKEKIIFPVNRFREMAAVGEIQGPKIGHYYLEVFSREYKNETPHITLELPRKPKKIPMAKIEIKPNQPGQEDEPNFLWLRRKFTISNDLKKAIQDWLVTPGKYGLTGWERSRDFWEAQVKSVLWGQLQDK